MSTDPRIAIVREWARENLVLDLREDIAARLTRKLDALPSPSGDDILQLRADESSYGVVELERMAVRLFSANTEASGMGEDALKWIDLEESAREFWRKIARAALKSLPPSGALGLARELSGWLNRDTTYRDGGILTDLQRMKEAREKARELVAMLGGEK